MVDRGTLVVGHSCQGRLPHTLQEAQAIAARWGTQALLEEAATRARVRQAASQCRVLHLATHGEGDGLPDPGAISRSIVPFIVLSPWHGLRGERTAGRLSRSVNRRAAGVSPLIDPEAHAPGSPSALHL